jgi:hypothetical protein
VHRDVYDRAVTIPGPATTYRYVADGQLKAEVHREATTLRRHSRLLLPFAIGGVVLGVGASLTTYHASLSHYFGKVVLIGVVWGLVWFAGTAVLVAVLAVPLAIVMKRRMMTRLFPDGSVTEVELSDDSLVLRRPARTRAVPYRAVIRVRATESFLNVTLRGRPRVEVLPLGLLPDDAIEFIRARARGAWPLSAALGDGSPTRQVMVPAGWAAHVAAVHARAAVGSINFLARVGLALLVSAGLALVAGIGWMVVTPLLALLAVAVTYARTRRAIATAMPTGSVATTEFLDDRFISRTARWAREIRFDDIHALEVRGDVVLIAIGSESGKLAMARALIPDDALDRLRGNRPGGVT